MQCFHSTICKSYFQIVLLTYTVRYITPLTYPAGFLMRLLILPLHYNFFFLHGSRVCQPIVTYKKQCITHNSHTYQMTQKINYFIISGCQPCPPHVERKCSNSYHQCHSDRYPPLRQCIFVNYIANNSWNKKQKKHQDTKNLNKNIFHNNTKMYLFANIQRKNSG